MNREMLRAIQRIQIQTKRAVQGGIAGAYLSAFKGRGLAFEEVREYQEGDEVRHIDWNVTARMNAPFVKVFEEEREITLFLIVDISASMRFGSGGREKHALMALVGGVIALSAIDKGDRVGLVLTSNRVEKYVPPGRGVAHGMRLIRELMAVSPDGEGSDLEEAYRVPLKVARRPSLCFVLSDFLFEREAPSSLLLGKKHEVVSVRVEDPLEGALPPVGLVTMRDEETGGERVIDLSREAVAEEHRRRLDCIERQEALLDKMGADRLTLSTDEEVIPSLERFFLRRGRRHPR